MKSHGDPGWEKFPSYFDIFIPHVLEVLDSWNLKITFFIVGQDAALDKNRDVLKLITRKGHEVGNHSFHHDPWLHLYSKDQIKKEISKAEDYIFQVTSQKPIGFRGPGFTWSSKLIEALSELDYLYDTSTLPTYIGPLARMHYFKTSNLTEEEKKRRDRIYSSFRDGTRSVKPYRLQMPSGATLLEIPVTTMPITKTPFHFSYLLYLSRFSQILMSLYLNIAIAFCKMTKTEPTFLIHPLDLLGGDQVKNLAFFPGMDLSSDRKKQLFDKSIRTISKYFNLVNTNIHAKSFIKRNNIPTKKYIN